MLQQKTIHLTSTEELFYNKLFRKKLVHRSSVDRCFNFINRNNLTFVETLVALSDIFLVMFLTLTETKKTKTWANVTVSLSIIHNESYQISSYNLLVLN